MKKSSPEQKFALVLLIKEILSQIDEVAHLKSRGYSAALSVELLHEMCSVLRELDQDLEAQYFELLLKLAGDKEHEQKPSAMYKIAPLTEKKKRELLQKVLHQLTGT